MTTALLESRSAVFGEAHRAGAQRGHRMTLEERLQSVWRSAQSDGRARCPVCHAAMRLDGGAAHCSGCHSALW